jgi:hypothetical protein
MGEDRSRRNGNDMRMLLGIVPVLLLLISTTHHCFEVGLQPDDEGYVALRVAENARTGHGLVFNPGEKRDLIDSPLWVAGLSLVSLSAAAPVLVQILGLLVALLTVLVLLRVTRSTLLGVGASLFLALDGAFADGITSGGSEAIAALYLVLLVPILHLPRSRARFTEADRLLSWWALLASCIRYEYVIVALPVALGAGLREPRRVGAWLPLLATLIGAGLVLGLRWHYFQAWPAYWQPWPPTRASLFAASTHLGELLVRRPLLLLAIGILVSDWIAGRLWMGRRAGLAWGLTALLLFALAPAGGADLERQVIAILPLGYLLAVEAVWVNNRTRPALVAALLLLVAQPEWTERRRQADPETDATFARIGQWLQTQAVSETVVGAERVGALGYFSRLRMEDVAGRVSPRVASARRLMAERDPGTADFQPMLHQEPDLVLVLPGNAVPSSRIYVPNDDAIPESIRGPYRVYRWAGSPVWRSSEEDEEPEAGEESASR